MDLALNNQQRLIYHKIQPTNQPRHDTKQSDGEVPVVQELWGMPWLPDPLRPGVVAPDRVLSMG